MHNDWLNGSITNQNPAQKLNKKDRRHTHVEKGDLQKIKEENAKKAEAFAKDKSIPTFDEVEVSSNRFERFQIEITFYSKKIFEFNGFQASLHQFDHGILNRSDSKKFETDVIFLKSGHEDENKEKEEKLQ
jgi:hypothetical protein